MIIPYDQIKPLTPEQAVANYCFPSEAFHFLDSIMFQAKEASMCIKPRKIHVSIASMIGNSYGGDVVKALDILDSCYERALGDLTSHLCDYVVGKKRSEIDRFMVGHDDPLYNLFCRLDPRNPSDTKASPKIVLAGLDNMCEEILEGFDRRTPPPFGTGLEYGQRCGLRLTTGG